MQIAQVRDARRGINLAKQELHRRRHQRRTVGRVSESRFDAVLDELAAGRSTVFVHVGLSDVKAAFDTDPYAFLRSKLDARFESVLAPGFTDYFKISGVYHKQHSRPKHGTFGTLFMADAEYRTDDAIKSILVRGPYRFDGCVHTDSYHENGCFAQLVDDDALVLNVGTPWIKCSHLHYLERRAEVDYVVERTYDGVLLSEDECRTVEQTCHEYASRWYSWNRPQIERLLRRRGVLSAYNLNGLRVYGFPLGRLAEEIEEVLARDPHFLVTA